MTEINLTELKETNAQLESLRKQAQQDRETTSQSKSSKWEPLRKKIPGAAWALVGVVVGALIGPMYQLSAEHKSQTEFTKQLFTDYARTRVSYAMLFVQTVRNDQLAKMEQGVWTQLQYDQGPFPGVALLEERIGDLAPIGYEVLSLIIVKEHYLADAKRQMNLRMADVSARAFMHQNVIRDLPRLKETMHYLAKSEAELISTIYLALVKLKIEDFIYRDCESREHEAMWRFWHSVHEGHTPFPQDRSQYGPLSTVLVGCSGRPCKDCLGIRPTSAPTP